MVYKCENCGHEWQYNGSEKAEPGVLVLKKDEEIEPTGGEDVCGSTWLSGFDWVTVLCNNCLHSARVAMKQALPGLYADEKEEVSNEY